MAVSHGDLEQLESYLDDELPMAEADALWQRLSSDGELATELATLRSARAQRVRLFAQWEPSDRAVADFAGNVQRAARRSGWLETTRRVMTYAAGAAACVLIGLGIGRYNPTATASHNTQPMPKVAGMEGGNGVLTSNQPAANNEIHFMGRAPNALFPVEIKDAAGQTISVQYFKTNEERLQFINDMNLRSTQQMQRRNSPVIPVDDEF